MNGGTPNPAKYSAVTSSPDAVSACLSATTFNGPGHANAKTCDSVAVCSRKLVFGNRSGKPLRESKLLCNVLQSGAEKAGLGLVTWHQFRHVHSSVLNDLKVPVKIAQEQLEHASIPTTLNIYIVVYASHRKAVEAVEERLFGEIDCLD